MGVRPLLFLALAACWGARAGALESSPAPGGSADGGRRADAATVVVLGLDAAELDAAQVAVPAGGMSAYYAMKRSTIAFDSTSLGGKSIVHTVAGTKHSLPKTAWILSVTHGGVLRENVNLAETRVFPGDELRWQLYAVGKQPSPAPALANAADEPAPAHGGDESDADL